jgi:hypothetical protein
MLLKVSGQSRGCRVSRKGVRETARGGDEVGVSVKPPRQRFARLVLAIQGGSGGSASVDLASKHRRYQVSALREVTVESGDTDIRSRGNLTHGRIHTRSGEDGLRRFEQRIEVALGVGAYGALRWLAPFRSCGGGVQVALASHELCASASPLTNGTVIRIPITNNRISIPFTLREVVPPIKLEMTFALNQNDLSPDRQTETSRRHRGLAPP